MEEDEDRRAPGVHSRPGAGAASPSQPLRCGSGAAEPAAQTTAPAHAGLFDAAPAGTPAPSSTDECFDDEDPDPENGEYADEHEEEQTACVA